MVLLIPDDLIVLTRLAVFGLYKTDLFGFCTLGFSWLGWTFLEFVVLLIYSWFLFTWVLNWRFETILEVGCAWWGNLVVLDCLWCLGLAWAEFLGFWYFWGFSLSKGFSGLLILLVLFWFLRGVLLGFVGFSALICVFYALVVLGFGWCFRLLWVEFAGFGCFREFPWLLWTGWV